MRSRKDVLQYPEAKLAKNITAKVMQGHELGVTHDSTGKRTPVRVILAKGTCMWVRGEYGGRYDLLFSSLDRGGPDKVLLHVPKSFVDEGENHAGQRRHLEVRRDLLRADGVDLDGAAPFPVGRAKDADS